MQCWCERVSGPLLRTVTSDKLGQWERTVMIRRIALAGVAGALALGGLAASGIGSAGAAVPTITTATSANISCGITAKVKLSPALKNNWDQQAHEAADGESNADVNAIPDTKFNTDGNQATTAKSKSISCTGSATDGTNTATITAIKVTLGAGSPGVDNPPLQDDNTCSALLAGTPGEDTGAGYTSTISFKASGAKLAPTTITNSSLGISGVGFALTGGTVSGSLAGGNGKTQAYLHDDTTLGAVTAAPATSSAPTPNRTCEANLKIKTGTHHAASLKGPKGLKKIGIGANIAPPFDNSSVCLRKGSSCP